jgi:surface protein
VARLAALRKHCADCQGGDVVYEVALNYSALNHTIAQNAAETLVYMQGNHSEAQGNYSGAFNEYERIKALIKGTPITWPDSQTLHQALVELAVDLKAQAQRVQVALDIYYVWGNRSEDAQANYTSAAANATTADGETALAQIARDAACAALSIAPSPPPSPSPSPPVFEPVVALSTTLNDWVNDQAATEATYGPIGTWDVSSQTSFGDLFRLKSTFNGPIGGWNVGHVTQMTSMFDFATSFNQDLSGWDTSSVTLMGKAFYGARAFDQDLSGWDVSSVTSFIWYGKSTFGDNCCSLSDCNKRRIHDSWSAQSSAWAQTPESTAWATLCPT